MGWAMKALHDNPVIDSTLTIGTIQIFPTIGDQRIQVVLRPVTPEEADQLLGDRPGADRPAVGVLRGPHGAAPARGAEHHAGRDHPGHAVGAARRPADAAHHPVGRAVRAARRPSAARPWRRSARPAVVALKAVPDTDSALSATGAGPRRRPGRRHRAARRLDVRARAARRRCRAPRRRQPGLVDRGQRHRGQPVGPPDRAGRHGHRGGGRGRAAGLVHPRRTPLDRDPQRGRAHRRRRRREQPPAVRHRAVRRRRSPSTSTTTSSSPSTRRTTPRPRPPSRRSRSGETSTGWPRP